MNLIRIMSLVLLALGLGACITFPETADEFRAGQAGRMEFTVGQPLQASYELVSRNTIRCHQGNSSHMSMIGSSFVVFPTGETRVEGILDSGGRSASLNVRFTNLVANGLLQVIDLESVSDSITRVVVYRLNDTRKWQTATEAVKNWFEGSSECYDMW